MANLIRYNSQVGLQGGPTQAQASYQTPIVDTVGKMADVASQFAQKYQQAQYDQNKIDTMLNIQKDVDAYQENLRVNPIQKNAPDDDIVALKEADWQKFSGENVSKQILSKIKDPRLKEDMTNWWNQKAETYRSNVVNTAMDENIAYMGQRSKENIETAMYNGQLGLANDILETSLKNGVVSREYGDSVKDQIALQTVLDVTDSMSIPDAEKTINESGLEATEKTKAMKYMKDRKKVRTDSLENTYKQYDSNYFSDVYLKAWSGDIRSAEELTAYISGMPTAKDPQYGEISGSQQRFESDHIKEILSIIDRKNKEEEPDTTGEGLSSEVKNEASKLLVTRSRPQILDFAVDHLGIKGYGQPFYDYLYNEASKSKYKNLNNRDEENFQNYLKRFIKDEKVTSEEEGRMRNRMVDWIQSNYSDEDIMREAYTDKLPDFFRGMVAEKTKYKIDKLQEGIMQPGGLGKISDQEQFQLNGRYGDYVGQVEPTLIKGYIEGTVDLNTLNEKTADYLYQKPYSDLNKDQKNKVKLSQAVGEFSKSVLRLADGTLRKRNTGDMVIALDKDNLPVIRFNKTDGTGVDYQLRLNPNTKEEEWWVFQGDPETGKGGWEKSDIILDSVSKPVSQSRVFLEKVGESLNPPPLENTDAVKAAQEQYPGIPGFSAPRRPTPLYPNSGRY